MQNVLALAVHAPPAPWTGLRVAVLVPCYNEAPTIANVVRDFRLCLPKADIYVYETALRTGPQHGRAKPGPSSVASRCGAKAM